MNITRKQRIAIFSLLALALLLTIGSFATLTNLSSQEAIHIPGYLYLLTTLPFVIIIVLVVMILFITRPQESLDSYREHTIQLDEESTATKTSTDAKKENAANQVSQTWLQKILPPKDQHKELSKYSEQLLSNLAKEMNLVQSIFFFRNQNEEHFHPVGLYAYFGEEPPKPFKTGETIPGQVAKNQQLLNLTDIPENYITILSGLGSSSPQHLLFLPVITKDQTIAIIELASFSAFSTQDEANLNALAQQITKDLTQF